ncbi:Transcription termination factor Rho 2 [Bienertia sinuspersici]
MENFPVIDLSPYLNGNQKEDELKSLCMEVSRTLKETGALLIRDPRCSVEDNDRFLDMMENYFQQPYESKRLQERRHLHYQVGVTPEGVEVPRSLVDVEMQQKLKAMPLEFQPITPTGPDPKWRYMWRIGPRPANTHFKELNAEPVIPEGFPEWKDTMDSWGFKMISAIEVVAEMAAIGFGLPKDAFTSLMKQGPHLLAPTGSDLQRHGKEGTVFAGYHYDLNFLTIHGGVGFQTGKQIEWLTAGECIAGMHEVVVTKRTLEAIRLASEQNRSLWRVSSTLFGHVASDAVLKPLGHFADSPLASMYPPMCAGEFVEKELAVINLKGNNGDSSS